MCRGRRIARPPVYFPQRSRVSVYWGDDVRFKEEELEDAIERE